MCGFREQPDGFKSPASNGRFANGLLQVPAICVNAMLKFRQNFQSELIQNPATRVQLPCRDYSSGMSQASDLRPECNAESGVSKAAVRSFRCLRKLWIRRPSSINASATTVTISQLSELI